MKVAELLELRRKNWAELERLCDRLAAGRAKALRAADVSRFASLYRAACADLATDFRHCGACGVQCLGSCAEGVCQ